MPRQTRDADLVVELPAGAVADLVCRLRGEFYVDEDVAREAVARRAGFNVIHLATGFKVDLFVRAGSPFDLSEFARSQPQLLVPEEDRRVLVKSPEDTILRKLDWYRRGGGVSDRQWSDALGVARVQRGRLDLGYLRRWAHELGVDDLLDRVLDDPEP